MHSVQSFDYREVEHMRDLNFFAPYIKKTKKQFDVTSFLRAALAVVLAGVLVSSAFLFLNMNRKKAHLYELQSEMENSEYQLKYEEAQKAIAEVSELTTEKEFFVRLQGAMMEVHRVNERFMQFLGKEVIKDLFLDDISIQNREITINGTALSKHAIAQFEKDLRATDTFDDVKITAIQKKSETENYYTFNMIIKSKVGEHTGNGVQIGSPISETTKNAGGEQNENKDENK